MQQTTVVVTNTSQGSTIEERCLLGAEETHVQQTQREKDLLQRGQGAQKAKRSSLFLGAGFKSLKNFPPLIEIGQLEERQNG